MMTSAVALSPLWASLLPAGAIGFETHDFARVAPLPAAEQAVIAGAAPARIAEFAAGRACARAALAALGHDDFALLRDSDRRPLWPSGIAGSITHTGGYCAAVVAPDPPVLALGIDAERIGRVHDGMFDLIATAPERSRLMAMAPDARRVAAALLFAGKEAFYKCHSAADGGAVGFQDVALTFQDGFFTIEPRPGYRGRWRGGDIPAGRYTADAERVYCAMALAEI